MTYQEWLNYIIRRASTGADVVDETGRRFPHTQPGVQGATRLKGAPIQPDPWSELVAQTGAITDAAAQRASSAGRGTLDYLTKPQPVVNRDTGYVLRVTDPRSPNWGKKREGALGEFTPGQRLAQTGVATAVVAPTAMAVNNEMKRRENQAMVDAALKRADGSIAGEEYGGRYDQALRDGTISGEGYGDRYDRAMSDGSITGETYGTRAIQDMGARAGLPPRRPVEFTAARPVPVPPPRPAEFRESPGILSKIFSGQDYQSANALSSDPRTRGYSAPVVQDKRINWGDPDSAADFFRADKALMAQRQAEEGLKRGGATNAKPDSVHKALEIIHHLLTRGH